MTALPFPDRRWIIARRWPRWSWDAYGRARRTWGADRSAFGVVFGCLVSTGYLELGLWLAPTLPWGFFGSLLETGFGRASVALLVALNAWILDRVLANETRQERAVRPWLRLLRPAAVGVPLFGLAVIPLWRRLVETRPDWGFRPRPAPPLDLTAAVAHLPWPSRLGDDLEAARRGAATILPLLVSWLIACQIAPLLAALSWLNAQLRTGHWSLVAAACIPFHLAGWATSTAYARERLRASPPGWRSWYLRAGPALFLLPMPLPLIGVWSWAPAAAKNRETTLSYTAATSSTTSLRIPRVPALHAAWTALRGVQGQLNEALQSFGLWSPVAAGEEQRRFAFYRLKSFLLLLDAAALAWLLSRLAGHPILPTSSPTVWFIPSFCLMAAGWIAEAVFALRRGLALIKTGRGSRHRLCWGRFLTLTQLALPVGLLLGSALAAGDAQEFGLILQLAIVPAILIPFAAGVGFATGSPHRQVLVPGAWAILFFEFFVTGCVLRYQPEFAPRFLPFFETALQATPLWSLGLAALLSSSLLRPYRWRGIFNRNLPLRTRWLVALTALTATLPFGGLAVPLWVWGRDRAAQKAFRDQAGA